MNVAHRLAMLVAEHLKLRTRSEKPGLLGRTNWAELPRLDRAEARMCGRAAVRAACERHSGMMITLKREAGAGYRILTGLTPLQSVAFVERLFPAGWRNHAANDVLPAFREYVAPLVGAIPGYEPLSMIRPSRILGAT